MPVHGADDREKNMETGLAVLFGVCCSVTDCKRRKITLSVLLAGAAAGCILSGIRIWQGKGMAKKLVIKVENESETQCYRVATEALVSWIANKEDLKKTQKVG